MLVNVVLRTGSEVVEEDLSVDVVEAVPELVEPVVDEETTTASAPPTLDVEA